MESEFFGYRKGAFTGAEADRDGFFQAANGGTLFLDEVADLPLAMQVKLLRAIQEKKVRKVGSTQEDAVDVRIISATHKNLPALVESGEFRQDLFYRLHVIELSMPSLREMREDIPRDRECDPRQALARHAGQAGCRTRSPRSRSYPFPGNVRELENILERGLSLAADPQRITAEDLHLTPLPEESDVRDAARREVAAAGLPRPGRAAGDQRGAREDPLQPHGGGQAARHHVPRDALPDGAAGHQVSPAAAGQDDRAQRAKPGPAGRVAARA